MSGRRALQARHCEATCRRGNPEITRFSGLLCYARNDEQDTRRALQIVVPLHRLVDGPVDKLRQALALALRVSLYGCLFPFWNKDF